MKKIADLTQLLHTVANQIEASLVGERNDILNAAYLKKTKPSEAASHDSSDNYDHRPSNIFQSKMRNFLSECWDEDSLEEKKYGDILEEQHDEWTRKSKDKKSFYQPGKYDELPVFRANPLKRQAAFDLPSPSVALLESLSPISKMALISLVEANTKPLNSRLQSLDLNSESFYRLPFCFVPKKNNSKIQPGFVGSYNKEELSKLILNASPTAIFSSLWRNKDGLEHFISEIADENRLSPEERQLKELLSPEFFQFGKYQGWRDVLRNLPNLSEKELTDLEKRANDLTHYIKRASLNAGSATERGPALLLSLFLNARSVADDIRTPLSGSFNAERENRRGIGRYEFADTAPSTGALVRPTRPSVAERNDKPKEAVPVPPAPTPSNPPAAPSTSPNSAPLAFSQPSIQPPPAETPTPPTPSLKEQQDHFRQFLQRQNIAPISHAMVESELENLSSHSTKLPPEKKEQLKKLILETAKRPLLSDRHLPVDWSEHYPELDEKDREKVQRIVANLADSPAFNPSYSSDWEERFSQLSQENLDDLKGLENILLHRLPKLGVNKGFKIFDSLVRNADPNEIKNALMIYASDFAQYQEVLKKPRESKTRLIEQMARIGRLDPAGDNDPSKPGWASFVNLAIDQLRKKVAADSEIDNSDRQNEVKQLKELLEKKDSRLKKACESVLGKTSPNSLAQLRKDYETFKTNYAELENSPEEQKGLRKVFQHFASMLDLENDIRKEAVLNLHSPHAKIDTTREKILGADTGLGANITSHEQKTTQRLASVDSEDWKRDWCNGKAQNRSQTIQSRADELWNSWKQDHAEVTDSSSEKDCLTPIMKKYKPDFQAVSEEEGITHRQVKELSRKVKWYEFIINDITQLNRWLVTDRELIRRKNEREAKK